MRAGFAFIFGLAVGAAAGLYGSAAYFKRKYEAIADEEIASVKERFQKTQPEKPPERKKPKARMVEQKPSVHRTPAFSHYASLTRDYISAEKDEDDEVSFEPSPDMEEPAKKEPYQIDPYEYGNKEGFATISWTCYEDGVIADERDEVVEEDNVVSSLGNHIRDHLYDEPLMGDDHVVDYGTVYIRNEETKCDYELVHVLHPYSEVLEDKPYLEHIDMQILTDTEEG